MLNCPHCGHQLVSRIPLTKRQAELYRFVVEYIGQHGYAPSFEEIAEQFNFNSLSTVHEHLGNLERKGYIRRTYNESRSIVCLVHIDEMGIEPPLGKVAS